METRFFICTTCGNVITKLVDGGPIPFCCGHEMVELRPNTIDGVSEKHLPVVRRIDESTIEVSVGSQPHPMEPRHHICFICLGTEDGILVRHLDPTKPAVATFSDCWSHPVAVYAYCNIHGLWKMTI